MSAILKFIRENHILALIEQAIAKKEVPAEFERV